MGPQRPIPHRIAQRLLLALLALPGALAPCAAARLPATRFTTGDGLPGDDVFSLLADRRGFVWIGTGAGAARFDGVQFETFGAGPGGWGPVLALAEAPDGTIWAASGTRLRRARPGSGARFAAIGPGDGGWRGTILSLAVDGRGRLLIGSSAGLFVETETGSGRFRPEPAEGLGTPVHALAVAPDGAVWAGTERGALRAGGGRPPLAVPGTPSRSVRALLVDSGGALWIGTTAGLCRVADPGAAGARCGPLRDESGRPGWVTALAEEPDGTIAVATTLGLVRVDPATDRIEQADRDRGLGRAEIETLLNGPAGDLWIGTTGNGLFRVARFGLVSYGAEDGLLGTRVASIGRDGDGELIVVATGHLFHRIDGDRFAGFLPRLPPSVDYLGWSWNQMWARDRSGDLWLATGRGLARYRRAHCIERLERAGPDEMLTRADGLPGQNVHRVYADRRGDLWISTLDDADCTLARRMARTGAIERFCSGGALPRGAAPTCFAEDRSGALWIGFYDGTLMRRREERFEPVALPSRGRPGEVHSLHLDQEGRLWVGAARGLFRIDRPESEHPRAGVPLAPERLPSPTVRCIVEGDAGEIYLGTTAGIARFDPARNRVRRYTLADGLPNSHVSVCARGPDGDLWFGTFDGVARLSPEREATLPEPHVFISGVLAGGEPLPLPGLLVATVPARDLHPSQRNLEIRFTGPAFGRGGRLAYQFRLRDGDAWSAPTRSTSVTLPRLAPGTYRFAVRALNADGRASAPASFRFTILPPLWRRPWFLALAAAAAAGLALLAHLVRLGRVLALERQRTRIAMDLHDEIGAGLATLSLLSDMMGNGDGDPAQAGELAREIGDAASELSTSLDEIVTGLRPGADTLASLAASLTERGRALFAGGGTRFETDLPRDGTPVRLSLIVRRNVYLIGLEALHNAARHAAADRVSLALAPAGRGRFALTVRDDGRGIDRTAERRPGGGLGLKNMRRRANEIGAVLEIGAGEAGGTVVRLVFPTRRRRRRRRRWRISYDHRRDGRGRSGYDRGGRRP